MIETSKAPIIYMYEIKCKKEKKYVYFISLEIKVYIYLPSKYGN